MQLDQHQSKIDQLRLNFNANHELIVNTEAFTPKHHPENSYVKTLVLDYQMH